MNTKFKPLGLAAAVAAATVGYSGVVSAQVDRSANSLGDLVLVPYYTVREGFGTGIHLINTSDRTQVVKVRFRRGADSMDALDFNIVMSPKDAWTGFLDEASDGNIYLSSQDTSCTAPAMVGGRFRMPDIYRVGAEEGYVEMIAMGTPINETQPIAVAARHGSNGVPANCDAVRDNFYKNGNASTKGVVDNANTTGRNISASPVVLANTEYEAPDDVLKISYFIRDANAGLEFGNDGVHVSNFIDAPTITNQQTGLNSGDATGFDYPDLDGGSPASGDRGKYDQLRVAMGGVSVINDWSSNADLNVGTDWVITIPGQYTMLDLFGYFAALNALGDDETFANTDAAPDAGPNNDVTDYCTRLSGCDNRDIPLNAMFTVYDREEQSVDPGGLVISPTPPGEDVPLKAEVNVVTWGVDPVLDSANAISVGVPSGASYGWAELSVTPAYGGQAVCDYDDTNQEFDCTGTVTPNAIPMIGFVAWERAFDANPDANYGRIVEHSYGGSGS